MDTFNHAFISYGRKESKHFASRLYTYLQNEGINCWFDQNDIPLAVDFQEQIDEGIRKADTFLFIIAPHSIKSPYCRKEIELAIKLKKRIIPILHIEPWEAEVWDKMHPVIGKLNWVYMRERYEEGAALETFAPLDPFESQADSLIKVLKSHADYVRLHTYFLNKAIQWEKEEHSHLFILNQEDLTLALQWSKTTFKEEQAPCDPTPLHETFIRESKKFHYKGKGGVLSEHKDAFISYSRGDSLEFCWDLFMNLTDQGFKVWFDQNDIPLGVDFQTQIDDGIDHADNFIFVIAPKSIKSEYCLKEVLRAIERKKRIIPILHIMPSNEDFVHMHEVIQKLNWVYLRENEDDYVKNFGGLISLMHTESAYIKAHTSLLIKAIDWDKHSRLQQFLLVGTERKNAEEWLLKEFDHQQPPVVPSDLHLDFLMESRKNAENYATDVFISYATEEREIKNRIVRVLAQKNITSWVHSSDIQKGQDFETSILRGIENADFFIFFISKEALTSEWCLKELKYAADLNKKIIPIKLEETDSSHPVPNEIATLQYIDITDNQNDDDLAKDLDEIKKELSHDRKYYQLHKVFLMQAFRWKRQNSSESMLLRGYNLQNAKAFLKQGYSRELHKPLDLHREFIEASELYSAEDHIDVFVSYSRKDSDFARKLNNSLQVSGKTTWFDLDSIAEAADFEKEILNGIEKSSVFLFVISPDSLTSPFCEKEIEYARSLNKKFVTVLWRDVEDGKLPSSISHIQWISLKEDFSEGYTTLLRTLDLDREHLLYHTKTQNLALQWHRKNANDDLLLRGEELKLALEWAEEAKAKAKVPALTKLQDSFLQASLELDQKEKLFAKQLRHAGIAIGSFILTIILIVLVLAYQASTFESINKLSRLSYTGYKISNSMPKEALGHVVEAFQGADTKDIEVLKWMYKTFEEVEHSALDTLTDCDKFKYYSEIHDPEILAYADVVDNGKWIVTVSLEGKVKVWNRCGELFKELGYTYIHTSDEFLRQQFKIDREFNRSFGGDASKENSFVSMQNKLVVKSTYNFPARMSNSLGRYFFQEKSEHGYRIVGFSKDFEDRISSAYYKDAVADRISLIVSSDSIFLEGIGDSINFVLEYYNQFNYYQTNEPTGDQIFKLQGVQLESNEVISNNKDKIIVSYSSSKIKSANSLYQLGEKEYMRRGKWEKNSNTFIPSYQDKIEIRAKGVGYFSSDLDYVLISDNQHLIAMYNPFKLRNVNEYQELTPTQKIQYGTHSFNDIFKSPIEGAHVLLKPIWAWLILFVLIFNVNELYTHFELGKFRKIFIFGVAYLGILFALILGILFSRELDFAYFTSVLSFLTFILCVVLVRSHIKRKETLLSVIYSVLGIGCLGISGLLFLLLESAKFEGITPYIPNITLIIKMVLFFSAIFIDKLFIKGKTARGIWALSALACISMLAIGLLTTMSGLIYMNPEYNDDNSILININISLLASIPLVFIFKRIFESLNKWYEKEEYLKIGLGTLYYSLPICYLVLILFCSYLGSNNTNYFFFTLFVVYALCFIIYHAILSYENIKAKKYFRLFFHIPVFLLLVLTYFSIYFVAIIDESGKDTIHPTSYTVVIVSVWIIVNLSVLSKTLNVVDSGRWNHKIKNNHFWINSIVFTLIVFFTLFAYWMAS